MIRNWGIRSRVLLLALVPVICLGVVLGTYLTRVRVHDLHASVHDLGATLANQLASASEYGVYSKNLRILNTLAQAVSREPGVESITITDRQGLTIAQVSSPSMHAERQTNNVAQHAAGDLANTLIFTRPIILQSITTTESGELQNNGRATGNSLGGPLQVLGHVTVKLSETHFAERQTQIIVNGGIIMLSCLALSILLALVIGGGVAVPITRVIQMVSSFSSGDYAARVPERSGGEIGQLESGINLMAENAERSQQELQAQVNQATAELRETMGEMEVKNIELDLARKRAQEASRAKSRFLSNMSHEIRTPMNAIVGFTGLLAKTRLTKDQRDYLATVQNSAATLLALIDDVLGLQSLEAGRPVQPVLFNLRELLEQAIIMLAPEAYRKELELILQIPVGLPTSYIGDSVKISRVLINLLSNAVKFTEHGQVKVTVRAVKRSPKTATLRFSVQDTGIGIQQEYLKELFTPFAMLNTPNGKHYEGTGLGLAISRQLMNALGGSLNVFSRPGEGSEFSMELALDIHPSPPVFTAAARQILLYETQPDVAVALQEKFRSLGYTVIGCSNLNAVVAQLRSSGKASFDMLVLSLNYAEVHNCERFRRILAKDQATPRLSLINSLESAAQQQVTEALGGVCLPKCIDTPALEDKIRQLMPQYTSTSAAKKRIHNASALPLSGYKVLIVEDNRINRRLIALQLRGLGADVMQAENGTTALSKFLGTRPDTVLLDMRLGQETGLEVAKSLVQAAGAHPVPIIVLSAASEETSVEALRTLGIRRWLLKPVDEQVLAESVLEAVSTAFPKMPAETVFAEDVKIALKNLRPEILDMLQQELPVQQQAVFNAWNQDDIPALQGAIHTLHGTAAMCKFSQLNLYCRAIEDILVKKPSAEYISSFKLIFKDELTRILDALEFNNTVTSSYTKDVTTAL